MVWILADSEENISPVKLGRAKAWTAGHVKSHYRSAFHVLGASFGFVSLPGLAEEHHPGLPGSGWREKKMSKLTEASGREKGIDGWRILFGSFVYVKQRMSCLSG
ncbi:hypothetical protein RRG08_024707 [Elysia crispata]|uniref:Uncharacterized protein n=1 Tax=Elysia crispata TaxID=231223 RepID=A0AAE0YDM1_9GAST|nr:hypothetical protein RRG08_024707 [Elysia crispata]